MESRFIEYFFQLSLIDQLAIRIASVFGDKFLLEQIRFVLELPDYQVNSLEDTGLITRLYGHYAFQQAQIRALIYAQLSDYVRRDLNRRCAGWYKETNVQRYHEHMLEADSVGRTN